MMFEKTCVVVLTWWDEGLKLAVFVRQGGLYSCSQAAV
jgi:hypothetical protein